MSTVKLEIMLTVDGQLVRLLVNFPKATFEEMNRDLKKEAMSLRLSGLPPYDKQRPWLSPVHEKARKFMIGVTQEIFKDKKVQDVHEVKLVAPSSPIITKI